MSAVALRATNLSKRFVANVNTPRGLKERLVRGWQPRGEEVWALRDASFEVPRGHSFGLVGHNGSGKSTALKVLTGIYRPTSGSVEVNGRVSALLELGAGFHGELTGRENVRLNGSILGLSRRQIDAMMAEIIDFSGIEPFIDSPVKVYSSGMYMRLGFAIAVKLDPEILIIDEIIAVGDEEFQRKCFDYMYELRQAGTTIVLVTHGLANIERMCDSAAWLDHGRVRQIGTSSEIVGAYLDDVNRREAARQHPGQPAGDTPVLGSGEVRLERLEFLDAAGTPIPEAVAGQEMTFRLRFRAHETITGALAGLGFYRENGGLLTAPSTRRMSQPVVLREGRGHLDLHVPELPLTEGTYKITTLIGVDGHWFDVRTKAFRLTVRSGGIDDGGRMLFPGEWQVHHDGAAEPGR